MRSASSPCGRTRLYQPAQPATRGRGEAFEYRPLRFGRRQRDQSGKRQRTLPKRIDARTDQPAAIIRPQLNLMRFYDAWQAEEHVKLFDIWGQAPLSVLRDRFERCNEVKLLNAVLSDRTAKFSLLEVGCATGEFSRYFRDRYPKVCYIGCDISRRAIERAQEKYPGPGRFVHTGEDLKEVAATEPDVVFSRDVILHQPQPFAFLSRLYDI